jgi:hypothetical protein
MQIEGSQEYEGNTQLNSAKLQQHRRRGNLRIYEASYRAKIKLRGDYGAICIV